VAMLNESKLINISILLLVACENRLRVFVKLIIFFFLFRGDLFIRSH